MFSICLFITIFHKILMMGRFCKSIIYRFVMFDTTPVFFGFTSYLNEIGKKPVNIATIQTIYFLHTCKVREFMSIHPNVLCSGNIRNSIEGEANSMIHFDCDIKNDYWNRNPINEWCREEMSSCSRWIALIFHG